MLAEKDKILKRFLLKTICLQTYLLVTRMLLWLLGSCPGLKLQTSCLHFGKKSDMTDMPSPICLLWSTVPLLSIRGSSACIYYFCPVPSLHKEERLIFCVELTVPDLLAVFSF